MGSRIYTLEASGKEAVSSSMTEDEAISWARNLIDDGVAIVRLKSDEGAVLDGKALEAALTAKSEKSPGN